jgi:hypothetical protein
MVLRISVAALVIAVSASVQASRRIASRSASVVAPARRWTARVRARSTPAFAASTIRATFCMAGGRSAEMLSSSFEKSFIASDMQAR